VAYPTTDPLPRGPHGLTREEVESSQRERLLLAMTDAVAELGYAKTSVADVLGRAGVSRATFYQLFSGKDECFEAAYRVSAELVADMLAAELEELRAGEEPDPFVRLDRLLRVYLDSLRAAPSLARVFLVEVYAAGPAAIEQRRASMEHFTDLVAEIFHGEVGVLGSDPEQRFAAEFVVGAVSSMVTNIVGVGDIDELPKLREPLVEVARQLVRGTGPR
jgi:AcrR family transcriptional regulator